MKKNIIIIILLVVILLLSGYLVYDKFISIDKVVDKINNEVPKDNDEIKKEEKEINVVTAFSGFSELIDQNTGQKYELIHVDYADYAYYSLNIPKINSELDGATKLNDKIMSDYQYYIDIINNDGKVSSFRGLTVYDVNYEHKVKNSIIYISMISKSASSSSASVIDKVYVYDIKNDKELNIVEVLEKNNIDVDSVKREFKEKFSNKDYEIYPGYGSESWNKTIENIDFLSYDYFYISDMTENSITIMSFNGISVTKNIN